MIAYGMIYTPGGGWEDWEHRCSSAERSVIKARAYELARGREDGPLAPTPEEWSDAGASILHRKVGMPAHGDRFVDRIEFEPGERH